MNNKSSYPYLALMLSMLLWSFSFIWFKQANIYYHPVSIVFFRLAISSIILYPVHRFIGSGRKITAKDLGTFMILALFNPFIYFIGESFGLERVSPTLGAVIIALIPVMVPFAAYYAFHEKLTHLNYFGILVSFCGVLIIIINKDLSMAASPVGLAFMFLAALAAVVYTILLKKITASYDPVFIITWQNIFGSLFFLPLFLAFGTGDISAAKISLNGLLPIFKLAIFASSFAFVFFAYGLNKLGASRSSIFTNIIPVITAILSYFILKENFSVFKIIGIMIVVGGLFFSQIKKSTGTPK